MIYGRTETLMTSLLWKTYRFYFAMGLFRNISQMTPKRDKKHQWHTRSLPHFCSHHILLRFKCKQGWKTSWKHTVFIYTYIFFLSSGSVGAGSAAVAVAAAQAVTTTLQMQPGRRASGALKPPYAAALGGCTDFWSLLFSWTGTFDTFCHEEVDIIFTEKKSANLSMCNENIS